MSTSSSMRLKSQRLVILIIRIGLGCLLIYSGLPKIRQPYGFLGNVYEYELVGATLGMWVAMTIPWLEVLFGICLLSGLCLGGALLASGILMGVFSFAQISALWNDLAISCGCFAASGEEPISYATLTRTVLLLLAAVLGLVCWCRCHAQTTCQCPQPAEESISNPA